MKENVLDKFYSFMSLGFDSNQVTIDKIVDGKVYFNLFAENYIYDVKRNQVMKNQEGEKNMTRLGASLKTKNGKETDIFHSYPYYKATAKQRNDLAFNKQALGELTERDKLLMRGYGQRIVEETQAFKYNNPDYVRKTQGKPKPTTTTALRKQFFAD
jgi:DNA polymerase III delta subunit